MDKYRLKFAKQGRAIYISHLDLMRTMHRSFRRADITLKMTEGFNPRPQTSILVPLSVGQSSICELMDFTPTDELEIKDAINRLNDSFPEGIQALEIYENGDKVKYLKYIEISGIFEYDDKSGVEKCQKLNELFSRESLSIIRRTKRGEGEFDVIPAIKSISFYPDEQNGNVKVSAVISAMEPTLNPEHITQAVKTNFPEIAPDYAEYCRINTYTAEMKAFR